MNMEPCPICGHRHDPEEPHDPSSMHYQLGFFRENGRVPTWEDAMAHCTEEIKDLARQLLKAWHIDPKAPADMKLGKGRAET